MKAFFLFSFLVLLTACHSVGQLKLVVNDRFKYQFQVPNKWEVDNSEVYINVLPPREEPIDNSVVILNVLTAETNGRSIEQCFETYLGGKYREEFESYSLVDQGELIVNNLKTRWVEHKIFKRGEDYTFLVYLIYNDDRLFILTAKARTQNFEKYRDAFVKAVKSFRVL